MYNFFLISKLNLPSCSLKLCPFILLLVAWQEGPIPTWLQLHSQAVVDSGKIPLEPPFLQAKHLQLPQLLFTGLVLYTLHLFCGFLNKLDYPSAVPKHLVSSRLQLFPVI